MWVMYVNMWVKTLCCACIFLMFYLQFKLFAEMKRNLNQNKINAIQELLGAQNPAVIITQGVTGMGKWKHIDGFNTLTPIKSRRTLRIWTRSCVKDTCRGQVLRSSRKPGDSRDRIRAFHFHRERRNQERNNNMPCARVLSGSYRWQVATPKAIIGSGKVDLTGEGKKQGGTIQCNNWCIFLNNERYTSPDVTTKSVLLTLAWAMRRIHTLLQGTA